MRGTHNVRHARCLVDHPDISACADELAEVTNEVRAIPYDESDGQGDLRYAWFKTDGHGQVIVALITADPVQTMVHEIAARLQRPAGIAWGTNASTGNDMRATTLRRCAGASRCRFDFGEITAHFGPLGFLQPNPHVAAAAYHDSCAFPRAARCTAGSALDSYAGAGVTTRLLRSAFRTWVRASRSPRARARSAASLCSSRSSSRRSSPTPSPAAQSRAGRRESATRWLGPTVCEQLNELAAPRLHLMSCAPGIARGSQAPHRYGGRYRAIGARAFDTLRRQPRRGRRVVVGNRIRVASRPDRLAHSLFTEVRHR